SLSPGDYWVLAEIAPELESYEFSVNTLTASPATYHARKWERNQDTGEITQTWSYSPWAIFVEGG
ncbi:hypothetical protein, partial [Thermogutta sp.]|uniref:hypothetical protein n=1 Tax=Thermogutta sp. TaxID=1962930 RepID=UPI00321FC0D4